MTGPISVLAPLFPDCPMPGCQNIVSGPREVCTASLTAFGPYLRPVSDTLSAEALSEASAGAGRCAPQHDQPAARPAAAEQWRPNQVCWCGEERRTCHLDPQNPDRMICRTCEAIQ
jgi:hypothetical protein